MEKTDVIVIGAGVVGLAVARALSMKGREIIIAESEPFIGSVTSARNSGVIHAGIYYPKGSAKARYCVHGRDLLYRYAKDRGVPYKQCGKLIVATSEGDAEKLSAIMTKAADNGVHDLKPIDAKTAMGWEPELFCTAALHSPSTGIIDVHEYLLALLTDAQDHGAVLALQNMVERAEVTPDGIILELEGEPILAKTVINAAGLGAQAIAGKIKGLDPATIPARHMAKGNYFSVSGKAPFSQLVYPVPVAGGLGAHFTMNMAGDSLFGPDVEWLEDQDYRGIDYNVLAARSPSFYEAVRRYWPGVDKRELNPAYSGVRPKVSAQGTPDGDFIIQGEADHGVSGLINLYGIESPGITSSLAIAEAVAALKP